MKKIATLCLLVIFALQVTNLWAQSDMPCDHGSMTTEMHEMSVSEPMPHGEHSEHASMHDHMHMHMPEPNSEPSHDAQMTDTQDKHQSMPCCGDECECDAASCASASALLSGHHLFSLNGRDSVFGTSFSVKDTQLSLQLPPPVIS